MTDEPKKSLADLFDERRGDSETIDVAGHTIGREGRFGEMTVDGHPISMADSNAVAAVVSGLAGTPADDPKRYVDPKMNPMIRTGD